MVVRIICVVSFVCFAVVNSEGPLEKGGYSVLVSFSQNINSRDGKVLLERMKVSLQEASSILYNAIGRQFTKVTVQIPGDWDASDWNLTTDSSSLTRDAKADFLIDNTNDVVFGKFPFAQQYGGCGIHGHQIIIPSIFFTDANRFPKGTTLAREWLKYRYGVFDENGYEEDPLYPSYYVLPGDDPEEVRITECTNSPVVYNFEDQTGTPCTGNDQPLFDRLVSKDCRIKPDEGSLENITSSVMYFQKDILNLQHICGKDPNHKHNPLSPNKHNAMCRGKSIWDVMRISDDFQGNTISENYEDIEFVYVQEAKPRVIVAWENTKKVNKTKGNVILNSIKRFVYDLPEGSKFGGFPFSSTLSNEKDYSLKELNNLNDKSTIMFNIISDFAADVNANISVAVDKALDILSSDRSNSEPEGTVIIITRSSGVQNTTLLERLQKSKVCVMLLYLSEDTVPDEAKNYVSALPCGSLEDISVTVSDEYMFNKLFASMETLLPTTVNNKITETVVTGHLSKDSPITFQVDESAENVLFWIFPAKESENFVLKFNEVQQKFKEIGTRAIMVLSFSPTQGGSIEFSYLYETEPIFTQVRVTSKAGKYLYGQVFTHDTSENSSPDQMPVIIYAVIRYGAYPVQNAKVSATVERPNAEKVIFDMFDDGRGDPDITQNDGVYSRYFTQFSQMGEYTVTVTVETGELTSYGVDGNAGYRPCCGSFLKTVSTKVPVSSKQFKAIFAAKSGRPEGGYKPSRILDLRIENATSDKIVLSWSAPGEEGDSGTASLYEIKLFCKEENSTGCDTHKLVRVLNKPSPLHHGTEQEATLQILIRSHILSVGIITYSSKNKTSELSNIVQIIRHLQEVTSIPETSRVNRAFIGTIVGSTLGCILLLICIIIASIFFCKRKPRYRKAKDRELEQNMNTDDHVKIAFKAEDPKIKSAHMKRIESFPVMLYTHDQIKDCRDKVKDPPLYKASLPPKPWASLDALSSFRTGKYDKDVKSLGSSSTIFATGESEMAEII